MIEKVSPILKIEFNFFQINDLHLSALESLFQFAAGNKLRFASVDSCAALRENSTMPIRRFWLGDTKGFPKDLHALEAFVDWKFNETGWRNHSTQ